MKVEDTPPGAHPLRSLEVEFELVRELGRGGSSVVYLAVERELEREVAIKTIHPLFATDPEAVARLVREARTLARLQHPNIVTFYGVRHLPDGGLAVVMQYVRGQRLKDRIVAQGPLAFDEVRAVLVDIARALAHAHRLRVVHRDIKPENIYLDQDLGIARLSDFGIARAWDRDGSLTQAGLALGTPAYMAPEQIDGAPLDGRSDLYSLGLVGYEMLSGERPWAGQNLYGIIYRQKNEALPPIAGLRPDVPDSLRLAIERALEKDPQRRWASAEALLECLGGDVATSAGLASGAVVAPAAALPPDPTMEEPTDEALSAAAPDDALTIPYRREELVVAAATGDLQPSEPADSATTELGDAALIAQLQWTLSPPEEEELGPGEVRQEPLPVPGRRRRRTLAVVAGMALALAGSASAFSLLRARVDAAAGRDRSDSPLKELAGTAVEPAYASPAPPLADTMRVTPATTTAPATALPPDTAAAPAPAVPVPAPTPAAAHADPAPARKPERRTPRPVPPPPPPPEIRVDAALPANLAAPAPSGPRLLGQAVAAAPARRAEEAPVPRSASVGDSGVLKGAQPAPPDVTAGPTYTRFQVAPVLRNAGEVQRAVQRFLPSANRETGRSGRVLVWILIDPRGVVQKAQVKEPSGSAPLDRAALQVAATMRFTPALNADQPVSVWVSVPVDFSVR